MALPDNNLLANETSPYLLQHKDNPVHWRPWSKAALDEAKELGKPILLSIGYAACHWCHVMEHECFEDADVAAVMNRMFVNIKVDREERPDIDQIYMTALQSMGDQGGWPLTMFLTPDARPFFGGTYFPKEPKYGRPGFIQLMNAVMMAWQEKRDELDETAHGVTSQIAALLTPEAKDKVNINLKLAAYALKSAASFDPDYGGQKGEPKFPNAPLLQVLWLNWLENNVVEHRDAVITTLRGIFSGGIYDHIGGGLSRYTTDSQWKVPHFEKMLYDNAQMINLASQVYSETKDPLLATRIEETITWLIREMRVEGGAFASSLDADSEGAEGKFYIWNAEEIEQVLGADTESFFKTYELFSPPEFNGKGILHRLENRELVANENLLSQMLEKLHSARKNRVRPRCDDKVLTDWNGLIITALANASRLFNRRDWLDAAQAAFDYIVTTMKETRLPHSSRGNALKFPAILSDYGSMITAAISLYQATRDAKLLKLANDWANSLDKWYIDESKTGYYLTASDSDDVPMRIRGDVDEAVPSAAGMVVLAFTQLAIITGDDKRYQQANILAEAALKRASAQNFGQAGIIYGAHIALNPRKLVIHDREGELINVADSVLDPRRVDVVLHPEAMTAQAMIGSSFDKNVNSAWLCIGQNCLAPVTEAKKVEQLLRSKD